LQQQFVSTTALQQLQLPGSYSGKGMESSIKVMSMP